MSKTRIMAGRFGELSECNQDSDDWIIYVERLCFYFEAHKSLYLPEDCTDPDKRTKILSRQRAVMLTQMGKKAYTLLRSLISPKEPKEVDIETLIKVMKDHQKPAPSPIVQRFQLNTTYRQSGQTVSEFIADLWSLAEHYDYGASLVDMIRDRIVVGVRDKRIQRRLLSGGQGQLTLKTAIEITLGMEAAVKNARVLSEGLKDS